MDTGWDGGHPARGVHARPTLRYAATLHAHPSRVTCSRRCVRACAKPQQVSIVDDDNSGTIRYSEFVNLMLIEEQILSEPVECKTGPIQVRRLQRSRVA